MEKRLSRLGEYLALDPRNPSLLVESGDAASSLGRLDEAVVFFERAHAAAPDDAQVSFKLGTSLLAVQQYSKAASVFERMKTAAPVPHPAVVYNLAYALVFQGRADESLDALSTLSAEDRSFLQEHDLLMARALYQKMDYARAIESIERYLKSNPDSIEGLGLKAQLFADFGRSEEAQAIAQALLAKDGNSIPANLVLGSVAIERRDANQARERFGTVVRLAPTLGRAWSGLGFSAMMQSKPAEARDHFKTSVRYMPNHLGTWHGLAWAEILLGDLAGARSAVESAMALDRTFSENHGTLAVIEGLEGHLDIAEAEMKKGIRLNPKSAASQFARSILLSQRGDASGSQRLVKKILTGTGHETDINIAQLLIDQHWQSGRHVGLKPDTKPH